MKVAVITIIMGELGRNFNVRGKRMNELEMRKKAGNIQVTALLKTRIIEDTSYHLIFNVCYHKL